MASPDIQNLLAAEEARRQAMLDGDMASLQILLAETLIYTHSTGVKDNKQSWLLQLSSGALVYEKLEFEAPDARTVGQTGLVNATMRATVRRGEVRRDVASTYLAVWVWIAGSGWQLQAVQATALLVAPK